MRAERGKARRKGKSILGLVRHLLNVAACQWVDENNLTWLAAPPKIKLLKVTHATEPYPLSWDEHARLFQQLPNHLARMARFKVNTGCRDVWCSTEWRGR